MKTLAERVADRVKNGEDNRNRGCQAFLQAVQAVNAADEGVKLRLTNPEGTSYQFNCNVAGEEPLTVHFSKDELTRVFGTTGADQNQVKIKMNELLESGIAEALRARKTAALEAALKL